MSAPDYTDRAERALGDARTHASGTLFSITLALTGIGWGVLAIAQAIREHTQATNERSAA